MSVLRRERSNGFASVTARQDPGAIVAVRDLPPRLFQRGPRRGRPAKCSRDRSLSDRTLSQLAASDGSGQSQSKRSSGYGENPHSGSATTLLDRRWYTVFTKH
jgi:hypothetical protein